MGGPDAPARAGCRLLQLTGEFPLDRSSFRSVVEGRRQGETGALRKRKDALDQRRLALGTGRWSFFGDNHSRWRILYVETTSTVVHYCGHAARNTRKAVPWESRHQAFKRRSSIGHFQRCSRLYVMVPISSGGDLLKISERLSTGIEQGESQFREFKSAVDRSTTPSKGREIKSICRDIGDTLVAFANADGGELFFGVEDEGTVTGIPHKEDLILAMVNAPKTHVHPDTPLPGPSVSRFTFDGVTVLYFQIAKSTTRVHLTAEGRCVQRFDKENRPVAAEDIQYGRQERASREYDREYIDGARVSDLDVDLLQRVSRLIAGAQSPEKFLQYVDLAEYRSEGLALRRAALLLFAKDMSRWHPRCQVRIARVSGTELGVGKAYNIESRDDHIVRGNILRILEIAWDTLRPYLARTRLVDSGMFAESLVYPEDACLEAFVNAVVHRDYSIEGKGIEILVFDDRLGAS
jgi:ATP-dependent DNA helicase RecG